MRRHRRADTAHVAGREVLLDPFSLCRRRDLQHFRLELEAMAAVRHTGSSDRQPLTCTNDWRMTHHADEIALTSCLDLQHAEAALRAVKGDSLDRTGEGLDRWPRVLMRGGKISTHVCRHDFVEARTLA